MNENDDTTADDAVTDIDAEPASLDFLTDVLITDALIEALADNVDTLDDALNLLRRRRDEIIADDVERGPNWPTDD